MSQIFFWCCCCCFEGINLHFHKYLSPRLQRISDEELKIYSTTIYRIIRIHNSTKLLKIQLNSTKKDHISKCILVEWLLVQCIFPHSECELTQAKFSKGILIHNRHNMYYYYFFWNVITVKILYKVFFNGAMKSFPVMTCIIKSEAIKSQVDENLIT